MMGKEMIVYKEGGFFKYALANMKHYMTLHAMPMYAFPAILKKYRGLLPDVTFQKGCVNFKMPKRCLSISSKSSSGIVQKRIMRHLESIERND